MARGPNATYILPARVGSVGIRVGSGRLFRYQHVGIPIPKCSCWGSRPMPGPIALQGNIGFT